MAREPDTRRETLFHAMTVIEAVHGLEAVTVARVRALLGEGAAAYTTLQREVEAYHAHRSAREAAAVADADPADTAVTPLKASVRMNLERTAELFVRELQSALRSDLDDRDQRIEALTNEVAERDQRLASLFTQLEEAQKAHAQERERAERLEDTCARLAGEHETLAAAHERLAQEKGAQERRISEFKHEVAVVQGERDQSQKRVAAVEGERDRAQTQVAERDIALAEARERADRAERRAEEERKNREHELQQLRDEYKEALEKIESDLKAQIGERDERIHSLAGDFDAARLRAEQAERRADQAAARVERAEAESARAEAARKAVTDDCESLRAELRAWQRAYLEFAESYRRDVMHTPARSEGDGGGDGSTDSNE